MRLSEKKLSELKARISEVLSEADPTHIVGVDEVGFGACAGPLVIGVVYVPINWQAPKGVTDSKLIHSEKKKADLAAQFKAAAKGSKDLYYATLWSSSEEIDRVGLGKCRSRSFLDGTAEAMMLCRDRVPNSRPLAIVDGNLKLEYSVSFPKADLLIPAVSMASIIAKDERDQWMRDVASKQYPGYGFEESKGYDTPDHRESLKRLGPCAIHRQSNHTIKSFSQKAEDLFELMQGLDDN